MQLILFIILAVFSAMALVGIGFLHGYLFGKQSILQNKDYEYYAEPKKEYMNQEGKKTTFTDSFINDEPSGIVMRPSPQELKKMNEDTATKEAKEAIAETFRNAEEPKI